jgi:hypothetical protein
MKYRIALVGTECREATMGFIEATSAQEAIAVAEAAFPSPHSLSYFVSLVDPTFQEMFDEEPEDEAGLEEFQEGLEQRASVKKIEPEPVRRYPIFLPARLGELKAWARTAREFEWHTEIRRGADGFVLMVGWTPIQSREEWEFFQRTYLATDEATEWAEFSPEEARFRELAALPWVEELESAVDDSENDLNEFFYWDDDEDLPF